MILALDLGTSTVKACLFDRDGLLAVGRAPLASSHPAPGRVEQDPADWWDAVRSATAAARQAADPAAWAAIDGIGFSTARETIVPVDEAGTPLGPALVWSDRRAGAEAAALAGRLGGHEAARRRTGIPLDGASVAAKLAWLAADEPGLSRRCRWLLGPRDLVVLRLTGEVATDRTVASRSGLYGHDLEPVDELVGPWLACLPPVHSSDTLAGTLTAGAAAQLALPPDLPVVLGAGDRACEVLGSGAAPEIPVVSWGTTANLSVPRDHRPDPPPAGMAVSAGAPAGWLVEAGQSGAGSALSWLGRLSGRGTDELAQLAATSPAGARGVLALPWMDGARAPWWRSDVAGVFAGLDSAQELGDLVRAVLEAVALDAARALEAIGPASELVVCGGGTTDLWCTVLAGVTGLPVRRRASPEAGTVGAALLAGHALGRPFELDRLNPVSARQEPEIDLVERYAATRPRADRLARAILELDPPAR